MTASALPVADPTEPDRATHQRVESDAGPLWLPRGDVRMLPYVRRRNAWDETGAGLVRTLVRSNFAMLDVGAGVGYHSILAWRNAPGVRIDAVEASPRALPLLRWNLWFNGVHQPQVHRVLLADAPGFAWLLAADDDVLRAAPVDADGAGAERVDVARADDHFADRRFDVVRVDLRGWEPEAVRGMHALLRRSPRVALVVAFWPNALRARGADPHDVLQDYRDLGLDRRVVVSHDPLVMGDDDVVLTCDNGGPTGRVNLLFR